jgi:hypothetical protein
MSSPRTDSLRHSAVNAATGPAASPARFSRSEDLDGLTTVGFTDVTGEYAHGMHAAIARAHEC